METVIPIRTNWTEDFQEWLQPFLAVFKRSEQRCWAPPTGAHFAPGAATLGCELAFEPSASLRLHLHWPLGLRPEGFIQPCMVEQNIL